MDDGTFRYCTKRKDLVYNGPDNKKRSISKDSIHY